MIELSSKPSSTSVPERYFMDVVAKSAPLTIEMLHKIFSQYGINGLTANPSKNLILPSVKDFSTKRASTRDDLHCNNYVEIGIVVRGEMTLWCEGSTVVCPTGSIFVIGPNTPYFPHVKPVGKPPVPHAVVWLALHRGSTVVHQCSLAGDKHYLSEYFCFTISQVMNIARNISEELAERAPHFETSIVGNLLCLMAGLLRSPVLPITRMENAVDPIEVKSQEAFSAKVETFLLSHYHRPLSLPQIARSVGCSPAYLCRRFRALTGDTPFQHLRTIRLEAAKHLLRSEVPIARVAEMVGIEDALYFSRVFSSYAGESPQSYRIRQRSLGYQEASSGEGG